MSMWMVTEFGPAALAIVIDATHLYAEAYSTPLLGRLGHLKINMSQKSNL